MKKIPAAVKKELEALAKALPEMKHSNMDEYHMVRGQVLIGIGQNKVEGKQVDPNQTYRYSQPKSVDHYKQMRKLWLKSEDESSAWQRIKTYESQMRHRYNETVTKD